MTPPLPPHSDVPESQPGSTEHRIRQAAEWKAANSERALDADLKRLFGITLGDFNRMVAEQGNVCAICDKPQAGDRRLSIDHDRACCPGSRSCGMCVRQLLCNLCNTGLGLFRESPDLMDRAKAYILRHEESK
ncbi:Recombination endonuclease VII OS=Streptomyces microflavus OX=1919 GN=Smic_81080 PE=4 SV=1 [Streptomyces microflavus]